MSLIEVCDTCGKQAEDGIFLRIKDVQEIFDFDYPKVPSLESYRYKIHICKRCVENIKKYCIEHIEGVSIT